MYIGISLKWEYSKRTVDLSMPGYVTAALQQEVDTSTSYVGDRKSELNPALHTPGLWQHETRDTIFTLVVDDFSIKYTSLDNAQHLLHALK